MENNRKINIGLLHSLTGTMALSEKSLLDAGLMAVREINDQGGILGHLLEPVIRDGESDPLVFAHQAESLIAGGAATLFGAWTSASRKAIKPLLERDNGLLFYPVQYEGLEESRHIVYTGSCLNQQIETSVLWALANLGKAFFLVGSDYVFPRAAGQLVRTLVRENGGHLAGEEYFELGSQDFSKLIENIRELGPVVIFNTLNGDSNLGFFRQFDASGLTAREAPVMSVSINETEIQLLGGCADGHYACWSYFQSLENDENARFVSDFRKMYGTGRVCTAPMVMAWSQVWLWKQAVERAGSFQPEKVIPQLPGCTLASPAGPVTIMANNHVAKMMRIGRVGHEGQFRVVWESEKPIAPLPWLGLEEASFSRNALVRDCLASYPELLHRYSMLEKEMNRCMLLEDQMKHLNDELEITIRNRTHELKDSIEELRVAKTHAEEASRLKSSLVLNLSHELRTPINGILGFGDILIGTLDEPRQKSLVNNMVQMGRRLLVTFTSMLKLSRLEAENANPVLEACNLSEFIRSEVQKYQAPAALKKITIKTDLENDLACRIDRQILADILFFLLDNAIKYTDEGYIWVKLRKLQDGDGPCIELVIKDTGIGISQEQMDYIFDAFRQGSEGMGRAYDGAGLGLTICKKLLTVLGGTIGVESTLGAGTSFRITLRGIEPIDPLILENQPELNTLVSRVKDFFSRAEPKKRVLIVEDNMINATLLVQYIEEYCYSDIAKNGQLALKYAWQYDYDLFLMDINLGPGLDGIQVTREMRTLKNYADVPVIAVTGYSTDAEKQQILDGGLNGFISKPFTQDELMLEIGRVLRIV